MMLSIALVLGVPYHAVGRADMPVVVSMLNAIPVGRRRASASR